MSIYFIQVGPVVKVGFSENPERRLKNLFRGSTLYGAPAVAVKHRAERRLLRVIDGDKDTERRIHRALSDFSVGLEWFVAEQPVLNFAATAVPADDYAFLPREGGEVVWPLSDRAGGNAELITAWHAKRIASRTVAGSKALKGTAAGLTGRSARRSA